MQGLGVSGHMQCLDPTENHVDDLVIGRTYLLEQVPEVQDPAVSQGRPEHAETFRSAETHQAHRNVWFAHRDQGASLPQLCWGWNGLDVSPHAPSMTALSLLDDGSDLANRGEDSQGFVGLEERRRVVFFSATNGF